MNPHLTAHPASRFTAFELSALRRLEFGSIAIPFAGSSNLGWYLKLWRKRVMANDLAQWPWWSLKALVENGTERLDDSEIESLAASEPLASGILSNSALLEWLSRDDALWFDALRSGIEQIESPHRRALALRAGLLTVDYALSFDERTWLLRRPLGEVFADLARADRSPIANGLDNAVSSMDAEAFLAQTRADLAYLRLPGPAGFTAWRNGRSGLREVWVRGSDTFWSEWETAQQGRFGSTFHSKRAYLSAVDRLIAAASKYPTLVFLWQDASWLTAVEVAEAISRRRHIRVVYSKDFSEVPCGRRTSAIVAEA